MNSTDDDVKRPCGDHEGCCRDHGDDKSERCCCRDQGDEGSECGCGCGRNASDAETDAEAEGVKSPIDFEALGDFPLPKPTLATFATTLAQQAMISMGMLPNPITGKTTFMLNQASHFIDTLDMIIEKTEGNRTPEETTMLNNVVHELRMLYVAAVNEKKRRGEEKKDS